MALSAEIICVRLFASFIMGATGDRRMETYLFIGTTLPAV